MLMTLYEANKTIAGKISNQLQTDTSEKPKSKTPADQARIKANRMKTYAESVSNMKREPIEINRPVIEKEKFIGDQVTTKSEFNRQLVIIQRNLNAQTQKVKQEHHQKGEQQFKDRFALMAEDEQLVEEVAKVKEKYFRKVATRGIPKPKLIQSLI